MNTLTRFVKLVLVAIASLVSSALAVEVNSSDSRLQRENISGLMLLEGKPFSGTIVERYEDGSLKMRVEWSEGKRHGSYESWHPNGQQYESRSYIDNRKDGLHLSWYRDGTKRSELRFRDGQYHGNCRQWYSNAQAYLDTNYEDGKEVGQQRAWLEDGTLRANYVVKNGHRYGVIGSKKCITMKDDDE